MDETGRHIFPSRGRVGAAGQAGLFVRSPFLSLGASLLGLGVMLAFLGERLFYHLQLLVSLGLRNVAVKGIRLCPESTGLLWELVVMGMVVVVGTALFPLFLSWITLRTPGKETRTAVELPSRVPPGSAEAAVAVLTVLVALLSGFLVARNTFFNSNPQGPNSAAAIHKTGELLCNLLLVSGGVFLLGGFVAQSIHRTRVFTSLRLSTAEYRREQRLHQGSSTVRTAARARA